MFVSGYVPSPKDPRDWQVRSFWGPSRYPSEYVVPDIEKVPVFDQGPRGTCVSQASTAMKMWQEMREGTHYLLLSREYLYARCKLFDGIPSEEGTYPRIAMDVLTKWGICRETMLPYFHTPSAVILTPQMDQDAWPNIIVSYARVRSLDALKGALMTYGPVVIGVPVYENWETNDVKITGKIPLPSQVQIGGHAILIYGWNETHLLVRNSWGTAWGLKGNGLLPITYPELYEDAWLAIDMVGNTRVRKGS